jgi:hypothetical protein
MFILRKIYSLMAFRLGNGSQCDAAFLLFDHSLQLFCFGIRDHIYLHANFGAFSYCDGLFLGPAGIASVVAAVGVVAAIAVTPAIYRAVRSRAGVCR